MSLRGVRGGEQATHRRWHVRRGMPNPLCPLCRADQHPRRKVVLSLAEIDALAGLVARVEAVDPMMQEYVVRVARLTRFVRSLLRV
jgi:hypothetical protein